MTRETEKIHSSTSLAGDIRTGCSLLIEGRVEGTVSADGDVVIEADAKVSARVRARSMAVKGRLEGSAEVEEDVEIFPGAKVTASLKARRVVLSEQAEFSGEISMDFEIPPE
jgi:cytoskeletal protein CcmA (bactofilin family)